MTLPNDLTQLSQAELIRIIFQQQDQIEALQAQVAELRSQINKQGPKQDTPPSWVKPEVRKKRTGERKHRLIGYARKLDTPTRRVFHSLECCPDCGEALGHPSVSYTRQVIDIPETPVEITEHVIFKRWCFHCKKRVAPQVNLTGIVVGQHRIGVRLMSIVSMLKEACRQPLETIQSYLDIVHNLHLSQGALVNMLSTVAAKGRPTYERLKQTIRASHCVHADETGGRENGKNRYTWSFSTSDVQFVVYGRRRNQDVVEEVLGDTFEGVLVTDFYTAYNIYNGFHQRCWVHYLRDIHDLKTQLKGRHPPFNQWAKRIKTIYAQAKAYIGPDPFLPIGKQEQERIAKQQRFQNQLRTVCEPYLTKESPMSTLCGRAIRYLSEMFVFVRFAGIPSDNNQAERAVRHLVIARKISGGTRSAKGSEIKSTLASLFGTWRLQNKNPLQQCQLLLTSCP